MADSVNEKPPLFTRKEIMAAPKRAGRIAADPEKAREHMKRKTARSKGRSSKR